MRPPSREAPSAFSADRELSDAGSVETAPFTAIYASPARYEPFGLGVLEAALSSCALVLGDSPTLREPWSDAALFVPPDDHDALLTALADVVLVHEWNEPALIARLGRHRLRGGRCCCSTTPITARSAIPRLCARPRWTATMACSRSAPRSARPGSARAGPRRAWTWHEAADVSVFRPWPRQAPEGDLVWVGNWGDDERTAELREFLLEPVRALGLRARVHGVRYPEAARQALAEAGIDYGDWLANAEVPCAFARHRVTVHVPRRPYVEALPGVPTIRVFEALACGIPLVSAPRSDVEGLFRAGTDFLVARDGAEMTRALGDLLAEPARARALAANGLATIRARHTCAHRALELLAICRELGAGKVAASAQEAS